MIRTALLLLSFFLPPVTAQCLSMSYGHGGWPMRSLTWHRFLALGHHIEFVPYGGQIAAIVLVDNNQARPRFFLEDRQEPTCEPRRVTIHGWAWRHVVRYPEEVDISLAGGINGSGMWRSASRDLRSEPSGFMFQPGITIDPSQGSTVLGLMIFDLQGYYSGAPDLSAVLFSPTDGRW